MCQHIFVIKNGITGCKQYGEHDSQHEQNINSSKSQCSKSMPSDFHHFLRQWRCAKHLWLKRTNVVNTNIHPRKTNELHMCVENDELLDKIEKLYASNLRSKKIRKRYATRSFRSAMPLNPKFAKHHFANVDSSIIPQDTRHGINTFLHDFITKMGGSEIPASSLNNIEVEKRGFNIKDYTNDKLFVVKPNWLRNKRHENLKVLGHTHCYTLNTCTFVVPTMDSLYKEGSKKTSNHKGTNTIILVKPNLERQVVGRMHKRRLRFRKRFSNVNNEDDKGEKNLWTQFKSWCQHTLRRTSKNGTNTNNVALPNLDDSNEKKYSNVTSWSHVSRLLKGLSQRSPKRWFSRGCGSKTIGLPVCKANLICDQHKHLSPTLRWVCEEGKSQGRKTNGDMCTPHQILVEVKDKKKMEMEAKEPSPRVDSKPRFLWMHSRATHILEAPSRLHGRLFRKSRGSENIKCTTKSTLEMPTTKSMSKQSFLRCASHKEHTKEISNKPNVLGNSRDACKAMKRRKFGRLQSIFMQKNDSQADKNDLPRMKTKFQNRLYLTSTPSLMTFSVEGPMLTKPRPKSSFDSKKPFWKSNHQRMKWSLPRLPLLQLEDLSTSKTIVRDNTCWDMDAQVPKCADNLHIKSLVRNPQKNQNNDQTCLEVQQTLTRRDFIRGTCDPGLRSLVNEDNSSMNHLQYKPFGPSTSK